MKRRIPVLAAAVACLLALTSGGALATGTLDQHQTNTSGYTIDWIPGVQLAQTFTAWISGRLDSVDLHGTGNGHSVTIEIEPATGQPTGTVLDKQTVNLNPTGWTHIVLKSVVNVAAGSHYAIVISQFTDVGWNGDCSNAYSGGQALVFDTSTWYSVPGWATANSAPLVSYCAQDYAFRTYVTKKPAATPTPVPTPAATTSATAATATPSALASGSPAASPSATSVVLGATAVASAGNGQSNSAGSGGSTDMSTPLLVGGVGLAALVGLLGFMMGRRRNSGTPGATPPGATPPAAGTPGADAPAAG
jgi:hypothetical protein